LVPFLDYQINRDYIAQNLCENKNDVIPTCGGSCYLKKELKKASEENQTTKSQINFSKLISETCFYSTRYLFNRTLKTLAILKTPLVWVKKPINEYFSQLAPPPEFC